MSKRVGRPTKFTPATVSKILRSVARGMPLVHAASTGGITFQTLTAYRSDHPDFADALAEAVAKGIEARLKVVERAMDSPDEAIHLRAACWYLEHTAPEHFAKNRIELTGADGQPLTGAVTVYLPQKDSGDGSPVVTVDTVKEIGNGN
jgi:hypothetical protein